MQVSVKKTTWPERQGTIYITQAKRFLHGAYWRHRDKRTGLFYMVPGDEWGVEMRMSKDDNFEYAL
jgi:hypothetical protein